MQQSKEHITHTHCSREAWPRKCARSQLEDQHADLKNTPPLISMADVFIKSTMLVAFELAQEPHAAKQGAI